MRQTSHSHYINAAINEYDDMRTALQAQVASPSHQPARQSFREFLRRLAVVVRLGIEWLGYRLRFDRVEFPSSIFVYSSQRTPRNMNEPSAAFLRRITRSNRSLTILEHVDADPDQWLCLQLSSLFAGGTDASSSLDMTGLVLRMMGWRSAAKLALHLGLAVLRRKAIRLLVARHLIQIFVDGFDAKHRRLVICTSNSFLVECLRLAALSKTHLEVVEILHGIAATGMQRYYDWIEENASAKIRYINLIEGLAQFESIERYLLQDNAGEIVINVQMWASLGESEQMDFGIELARQKPVAFIGGWSAEDDYLETDFFERECEALGILRDKAPKANLYYCPHPQLNCQDRRLTEFCENFDIMIAPISTLQMTIHCAAAIGTFSSSVFEASLLEKPVLLLPFDENIVLPELLCRPNIVRVADNLNGSLADFAELIKTASGLDDLEVFKQLVFQKLGLPLNISIPETMT